MAAPDVRGASGRVQLGRSLGRGGEGEVFEAAGRPDVAAKIYLAPASSERSAKLVAMEALRTPELAGLTAWPIEVLRYPDGRVCGFLMANLRGSQDIHKLYSPKSRLSEFPHADWRLVVRAALNTARAFAVLHKAGHLVGDVNHGGVRVSQDATVKLIDCDSFQVSHQGRIYVCEVGVQDFTPPELQGKAFKDTTRSTNHDNFGLAVLMFQLLLNGRHPFAGRYSGAGDMPIEKAIPQFCYAYSTNGVATGMTPPPFSAPALAASPQVAALWERAFGRSGVAPNGRPSAHEWVNTLTELEKNFTRCSVHPSHYYFKGNASCPWCPIEKAGVALFPIPPGSPTLTIGGQTIDVVWRDIEAIRIPPLSPLPSLFKAAPTQHAVELGKRHGVWRAMAWVIGLVIAGLGFAYDGSLIFIWLLCAWVLGAWVNSRGRSDHGPLKAAHAAAKSRYDDLCARWNGEHGARAFDAKRAELQKVYQEWTQLPAVRQQRYASLVANREQHARRTFLDSHSIFSARIVGIGPAKKSELASFGIDTAADVNANAVMQVPGFGPALTQKLLAWRKGIEQRFRFDPHRSIDPRQVADMDRTISIRRADLENQLRLGRGVLVQMRNTVFAHRKALEAPLQEAAAAYSQTAANIDALK